MAVYTILQVAQKLGISTHTLRYYEREGLLWNAIRRNASGHRSYTEQDILWFKLLICLRQTGMPLEEIKRFTALSGQGSASLHERHELLVRHRASLEQHIASLQKTLATLNAKVAHYEDLLKNEKAAAALEQQLL